MSVSSGNSYDNRNKLGGGFIGGGPSPILKPRNISTSGYSGSPRYSADSMFSIYTGAKKSSFEDEEMTAVEEEVEETLALETKISSVLRKNILICENELKELGQIIRMVPVAVRAMSVADLVDDDEDDIDEASVMAGGSVQGYTGPLSGSKKDLDKQRKIMNKMYGEK